MSNSVTSRLPRLQLESSFPTYWKRCSDQAARLRAEPYCTDQTILTTYREGSLMSVSMLNRANTELLRDYLTERLAEIAVNLAPTEGVLPTGGIF